MALLQKRQHCCREISYHGFLVLALYLGLVGHGNCADNSSQPTNATEIHASAVHKVVNVTEPLYLTPLIEAGDILKARALSEVHLPGFNATSYSGLITTDADAKSNMFFWFFPTADKNITAPLILWLSGGFGCGSMEAVFGDSGPFTITEDFHLVARHDAWTSTNNVLYLDTFLGSGTDSTDFDDRYADDAIKVAVKLYKCLLQFFNIFEEQRKNDIYIVGKSNAGSLAQSLAYYIHLDSNYSLMRTHLNGIILLSGLREPLMDLSSANYLYQVGLVNEKQVMYLKQMADLAANAIQSGDIEQTDTIQKEQSRQFQSITGLASDLDIVSGLASPLIYGRVRNYTDDAAIRNALHVGNLSLSSVRGWALMDDYKSHDDWLEFLLNNDYKVLIVGGQFDAKYNPAVTDLAIGQLTWKWTKDYFGSPRKMVQNSRGEIAGYVTSLHNLCYVTLRLASHYVTVDQPEAVFKVVQGFLRNETFFVAGSPII